ncbi:hypothetical protein HK097_003486, partial [Rhizophlyctis rosea]
QVYKIIDKDRDGDESDPSASDDFSEKSESDSSTTSEYEAESFLAVPVADNDCDDLPDLVTLSDDESEDESAKDPTTSFVYRVGDTNLQSPKGNTEAEYQEKLTKQKETL